MKYFKTRIVIFIVGIAACLFLSAFSFVKENWVLACVGLLGAVSILFTLYFYITRINQKLRFFFESVKYSDFTVKFTAGNSLGAGFNELNQSMNEVMEAFRLSRAENEGNLLFLNTLLQHIDIGLLSFDSSGEINLFNNAALRYLNVFRLRHLGDLEDKAIYAFINKLDHGKRILYQSSGGQQLSLACTKINIRGKELKIVSIQNIRTELQEKELTSWQNLTKVLRHEIMNSIAPIVSLVGTMQGILKDEIRVTPEHQEALNDLNEALGTIATRGSGIMNFVNAYRDFTSLPKPNLQSIPVQDLIKRVMPLLNLSPKVKMTASVTKNFDLFIDTELIEMVLLNLLKNAADAVENVSNPTVELEVFAIENKKYITVKDNGPGMLPEVLEKIFIPFYTTKKNGQGIGLSLSRQIMQNHGGDIEVKSDVNSGTSFRLVFIS